ncbi:nucleotidyltransferase domain-containing protein [Phyllobacterium sp. 22552]|uniref:nucleotidyltransferase domain-containing protein n=1 Tax=Phyllobacterium sp. 22552 TaxID=3453941 RepID=UPI003F84A2EB
MAITEEQLTTWSNIGSLVQSAETYSSIKQVIEDKDAPYATRKPDSFLQGSYGNRTNVLGTESDVDVVLKCGSVFYYDIENLEKDSQQLFKAMNQAADYRYENFKKEVSDWLEENFGADFDPGQKAIRIKGRNNRREVDVLPCVNFRRYTRFTGAGDQADSYVEGVCFFLPDQTKVVNYPKLHHDNCALKNQDTAGYFKEMVRIFKNMRNRMRADNVVEEGIAPSYYLEGMLWNVPNELFGGSYEQTFIESYNWLINADEAALVCANRQAWLLREGTPTSWNPGHFNEFMIALADFWKSGG